jgi:hypothetical protein
VVLILPDKIQRDHYAEENHSDGDSQTLDVARIHCGVASIFGVSAGRLNVAAAPFVFF